MSLNIKELAKFYEAGDFESLFRLLDRDLNDAHLLSLRGITKKALGQIEPAIADLEQAVKLLPGDTDLLTNLGNAYREAGKLASSESAYESALAANPKNANAHDALGLLLFDTGDYARAAIHFKKCINLSKHTDKAWYQLGEAYRKSGKLEEAIKCYQETEYHLSKSNLLECYYRLGDPPDLESFREIINQSKTHSHRNALSGSIISHANHYFGTAIENPFCEDPLSSVATGIIKESEMSDSELNALRHFIDTEFTEYRTQSLLINGRQSSGNLFSSNHHLIKKLHSVILSYIDKYREKFPPDSNFIRYWPKSTRLYGWVVDMEKNGMLNPHIHKEGWVSGCFYLDMPNKKNTLEGAISFSIEDAQYPALPQESKIKNVATERKMICMFPSSLHHFTRPFSGEGRRLSFAFDLLAV